MPGLVDSLQGLSYKEETGLTFERGLSGSHGLINPLGDDLIPVTALFVGAGGFSISSSLSLSGTARFVGSGSVSENATLSLSGSSQFVGSGVVNSDSSVV